MGFNTIFTGTLKFNRSLSPAELGFLKIYLADNDSMPVDGRDHPNWKSNPYYMKDWYYIDLQLTIEEDGLTHNGAEKTYSMENIVNFLTIEMRKIMPDFCFVGELFATDDYGCCYKIKINKDTGLAYIEDVVEDSKDCKEHLQNLYDAVNDLLSISITALSGLDDKHFNKKMPVLREVLENCKKYLNK